MKKLLTSFIATFFAFIFLACAQSSSEETPVPEVDIYDEATFAEICSKTYSAISISDFSDGIHHARYEYLNEIPPYELYSTSQILGFAENMVYLQNPDGGWAKNIDYQRIYSLAELKMLRTSNNRLTPVTYNLKKQAKGSTLDNGNIHSQIRYLCQVYELVKKDSSVDAKRYLNSATQAVQWILNAQHPDSGGWTGADVYGITYNDDVITESLNILQNIKNGSSYYNVFPSSIKKQAAAAYKKGLECILKTQITVTLDDGTSLLTAWCQQHYHENLQPRWAREFEPPSICSTESFAILQFLMNIENPSAEIKKAVKAGVEFFDREDVRIHGKKVYNKPLDEPIFWESVKRTDTFERVMEDCSDNNHNNDIWARFYALDSSFDVVKDARHTIQGNYPSVLSPIWCDRRCKYVESYSDLSQERRSGYGYTSTGFYSVLNMYKSWKIKNGN